MDLRVVIELRQATQAAARSHHRAAAFHRKQAADLMRRLAELDRLAAEYGIHITTESDTAPEA